MARSKIVQAFTEGGNIISLASVAALSAALISPVPLLAGVVLEAAYLLFVPDSQWYTQRLASRTLQNDDLRRAAEREETLPTLRPELRARYQKLEAVRGQIASQTQTGLAPAELAGKLDYLLDKFLLFAGREQEFRNYLQSLLADVPAVKGARIPNATPSTMPDSWITHAVTQVQQDYAAEALQLQQQAGREADPDSKAVLSKRAEVITRRAERVQSLGKTLTNLSYQLQLLEDTFGLMNDEVRARSPEQVVSDIDDVTAQADAMTRTLEEIAPFVTQNAGT